MYVYRRITFDVILESFHKISPVSLFHLVPGTFESGRRTCERGEMIETSIASVWF